MNHFIYFTRLSGEEPQENVQKEEDPLKNNVTGDEMNLLSVYSATVEPFGNKTRFN